MPLTKPITPHLWFNRDATDAVRFYCSHFPNAEILHHQVLHDTPSGDCDVLRFRLNDQPFLAISAGPAFTLNPAISFILNFDPASDDRARERLDQLWEALSDGGEILMPLDAYPFSQHYGWVQDRFGVSWQLILSNPHGEPRPFITPALLFTGDVCGKAEEAGEFYRSVFEGSRAGNIIRWPADMAPKREGTVMFSDFQLDNTWIAAMDSAQPHPFGFNESVSFMVYCDNQADINRHWEQVSAFPEAEQCGWCKDRFGVSWQIVPTAFEDMMSSGNPAQVGRLMQAFTGMKKLDIAALQAAFAG